MSVYSLLLDSQTPDVPIISDSAPVLLGMRFSTSAAGWITHLRFWKNENNIPSGNGWSQRGMHLHSLSPTNFDISTGLLGTTYGTVGNETATGWQNIPLPTPAYVTPGTMYIVTVTMPAAFYSATGYYFQTAQTNGPLTGITDGNGSYHYPTGGEDTSVLIPGGSFHSTNYFVDVVWTDVDPTAASVNFKQRESGAWVPYTATPNVWTGSDWISKRPKRWDGTAWRLLP